MSISFNFSQNDAGFSLSLGVEVSSAALSHALESGEGPSETGGIPCEAQDSIRMALQKEAVELLREANLRLQIRLVETALAFLKENPS